MLKPDQKTTEEQSEKKSVWEKPRIESLLIKTGTRQLAPPENPLQS